MDVGDFILLFLTPIGTAVLVGIGASYLVCNYVPFAGECAPVAAWIIAISFLFGVALTFSLKRNARNGN